MKAAAVRETASALLCYPDDAYLAELPRLRALLGRPGRLPVRRPFGRSPARALARFMDHAAGLAPGQLAAHYVETFDLRRRCCLYLTYYADGDTRRRGASLARLKGVYRSHGWVMSGDELPDFLPAVLEFAARDQAGEEVLREFRPALELLRKALDECASPYADVVEAVCATLPSISRRDLDRSRRLEEEGPPVERIGVTTPGAPG